MNAIVRLSKLYIRAQEMAKRHGFDPMDEAFARCVGAIIESQLPISCAGTEDDKPLTGDIEVPHAKPPSNWKAYE